MNNDQKNVSISDVFSSFSTSLGVFAQWMWLRIKILTFGVIVGIIGTTVTLYQFFFDSIDVDDIKSALQEVILEFTQDNPKLLDGILMNASIPQDKSAIIQLDFEMKLESSVSFDVGEQAFFDDYRRAKVANTAREFVALLANNDIRPFLDITVDFFGSSDGIGGDDLLATPYSGAFGDIYIEDPIINGANSLPRSFKRGQRISNSDLALIRAYSMFVNFWSLLERDRSLYFDSLRISAITNTEIGHRYRTARVTIIIRAKESELSV
ncbi:MAG: hypothetical protein ACE37J_14140 [Pikeienuella sp.]|uniref:hypothetical protein n=1 Tax=Pikeienuella sp. TaxID=2831957 RepID=UPI00391DF335